MDLGTLGGSSSQVTDVSGDIAVGVSATTAGPQHAFAYEVSSPTTGMIDLGTLGGAQSNAQHVDGRLVVGNSMTTSGQQHAFAYDLGAANPRMVDLGTLGGSSSNANGTDGRFVVGSASNRQGQPHAFVYDTAAATPVMVDLGTLGGTASTAFAVSNGVVVGDAQVPDGDWHAFAYDLDSPSPQMTDLGTLVGGRYAEAVAISGNIVVGNGFDSSANDHAFMYDLSSSTGMVDLGTLGGDYSHAFAVDDGVIVGDAETSTGVDSPFVYDANDPSATLIEPTPALGGVARGISDGIAAGYAGGHAFVYDVVSHTYVALDGLGGNLSQAFAISHGLVGGFASRPDGSLHAVVWKLSTYTAPPVVSTPMFSVDPVAVSGSTILSAQVMSAASEVVRVEYFIGDDPGLGRGMPMSVAQGVATATIGASTLSPGVYEVGVRAEDNNGLWSMPQRALLVVYDPTGGFVTGGGWIVPGSATSETGDALPGLDGTSKANFGFVVRYQSGQSTVPSGNFEFHYNVGNFHLSSTGFAWMAVTNTEWAHLSGSATINGGTTVYPIRVDARDADNSGTPDYLTVRVYTPGSNPETAAPLYQASGDVSGGEISIHSS